MIDSSVARETVTFQQFLQFTAETVRHRQIQRAKVLVERHVCQILCTSQHKLVRQEMREVTYIIDVKEEGIVDVLRRGLVRYPVKFV